MRVRRCTARRCRSVAAGSVRFARGKGRRRRPPEVVSMADHRVLATLVALLVIGTSACAGVPDHSSVREGNPLPAPAAEDPLDIRLLVRAAAPGASPTDIVRGFLTASASFDGNHAVGRTYLTTEAARTWDAADHVIVYDDSSASPVGAARATKRTTTVQLRAPELARIGRDGAYTVSPPSARLSADLKLVREEGEWRIANPPAGVMLTTLDLARSLQQLDVFFLTRGLDTVVPDQVYLSA